MLKIKILTTGKCKENWLTLALQEYEKRVKPRLLLEWVLAKNGEMLTARALEEPLLVALDPKGKLLKSEELSHRLIQWLEKGNSRLSFVIGGAEGLSSDIKKNAFFLWSLSPLTFTHQMTRLILVEQLYRALEIEKGSGYHKSS